jgi:hypothetical protein
VRDDADGIASGSHFPPDRHLGLLRTAYEVCLATAGKQVSSGPDWLHEIKHVDDKMLLPILERGLGDERIAARPVGALAREQAHAIGLPDDQHPIAVIGETVVLDVDGISDFNALHSRKYDHEVQLYAFDILALGGDDLRSLPLHMSRRRVRAENGGGPGVCR